MEKIKKTYVVGFALILVVAGVVYFLTNSDKLTKTITSGIQKTDCDKKFLEWCKSHSVGVDYDNFASENRECKDLGSYRTCQQVSEALS